MLMEESQETIAIGLQKYKLLMAQFDNNFAELLSQSEAHHEIIHQCLDTDLESVWEIIWEQMNAEPTFQEAKKNTSLPYRPLKPQPFLHPFYRVAGLHYFHLGKPGSREFLLKAAAPPYCNFYALRRLTEEYVLLDRGNGFHFALAITQAKSASTVHHAPGYILLAETYFDIACFYNKKQNFQRSGEYFKQAFINLVIADELQPHCANSMHNAYYGLGLKLSNQFEIETIQDMLTHLVAAIEKTDSTIDIPQLRTTAKAQALDIIREYYEPEPGKSFLFKKQKSDPWALSFNL